MKQRYDARQGVQPFMDAQQKVLNSKFIYDVQKTNYDNKVAEGQAQKLYDSLEAEKTALNSQASGSAADPYQQTAFRAKADRIKFLQANINKSNVKDIMSLYKAFAVDDPEIELAKAELEGQARARAAGITAGGGIQRQVLENQGEIEKEERKQGIQPYDSSEFE